MHPDTDRVINERWVHGIYEKKQTSGGKWGSEEAMHEQRPFQGSTVMTLAKKHYSRKNIDKMVELMEELTLRVISTYALFLLNFSCVCPEPVMAK
eukprot:COSAG06_NODE_8453_length_2170_cov_2.412844_5_plen_95_part_00